jgi:signal peptidase II
VTEAAPETSPPPRPAEIRVGATTDALSPVSVAERRVGASVAEWVALASVAVAAALADQATKLLVSSQLALGDEVVVISWFSIHRVENSGIAFGLFPTATSAVIALTSVVVAWMVVFFARSAVRHPMLPIGLGLVLGGSVSNLLDRVRLGAVTDFLDVRFWPAFNLADTFIVVGVAVLLASLVAAERGAAR